MLVNNIQKMGNNLLSIRKRAGLTQAEVAEKANISDRTYADIERGGSNMRAESLIIICNALQITNNDIFIDNDTTKVLQQEEICKRLNECTPKEQQTALELLDVYLRSLNK